MPVMMPASPGDDWQLSTVGSDVARVCHGWVGDGADVTRTAAPTVRQIGPGSSLGRTVASSRLDTQSDRRGGALGALLIDRLGGGPERLMLAVNDCTTTVAEGLA